MKKKTIVIIREDRNRVSCYLMLASLTNEKEEKNIYGGDDETCNGYMRIKRKEISLTMHAKAMYQITCIFYYRS